MSNDKMRATFHGPASDPWAALAAHGEVPPPPDAVAPYDPGPPPWAAQEPPRRGLPAWAWVSMVLGVVALIVAGCVGLGLSAPAPQPIPPLQIPSTTGTGPAAGDELGLADWSWTPTTTPANRRTIEVVDQLKPSKWKVSQAAEWVDRYTASNMKTVSRCSGRAWKCVYVRGGKLGSNWLAVTRGNTITVDYGKVDRRGYRSNTSREKILAHEIVHTFGYKHGPRGTLMATSIGATRLYLNASQRAYLRKR